jgi:hypothetical protein
VAQDSYSSYQGGNCVEVCNLDDGPAVRDSKNQAGAILTFTAAQWAAFTTGLRAGDFD